MNYRNNCGDDTTCGCGCTGEPSSALEGARRLSFRSNADTSTYRKDTLGGKEHLIIPVVMMRSDVVMNGVLVPASEMVAFSWNGVPVTVGHPTDSTETNITANSPDTMDQWAVGQIFNAYVSDGVMKAEAWIDVEKAEANHSGLIERIMSSQNMDVSTGFFSAEMPATGTSNGRTYNKVANRILPDHLALLPDETGACSWEDGCGVRNNQEKKTMSGKISAFMKKLLSDIKIKANERGKDDDWGQMIADLVSDDRSPFVPDDLDALSYMSIDTLTRMRDDYLGKPSDGDEPQTNEDGKEDESDMEGDEKPEEEDEAKPSTNATKTQGVHNMDTSNKGKGLVTLSANELDQLIGERVTEALKANALTDADRAALAHSQAIVANHRQTVVDRIVANSNMTAEQLESMDQAALDIIANGLRPATDYSGRMVPVVNAETSKDNEVAAMTSAPTVDSIIANRKAK